MKRSEITNYIEKKIETIDAKKLNEVWNTLFEEEKIDEINKKNKRYFIDLIADEIPYAESKNLVKAYKLLKEFDL